MAASYDYEDDAGAGDYSHQQADTYDPSFVPDSVKSFVVHLYRHIREKNVYEIHQMYETSFQTLSDRMFKETPWPSVEAVAPYVDNDHVFCLLYREMWFRHLYARLSPSLKQRIDSWDNYCNLFQVVLHGVVNMQLPNQWLWDMVDEFVYQFQSFCQYRAKMKSKTEQEIALLKKYDQAWNVYGVLNFLQALVEKSTIIQILEQEKEEGQEQFTASDGYDYSGGSNVLKVLGYFSMIGLLRVHCLLGDYHTGLKCLLPIDISQQDVYISVIGSHITIIYNYGFANLMMRSAFTGMLMRFVNSTKSFCISSRLNNTIRKLATYLEVDTPTLRTILMTYIHKTRAVDPTGKVISIADIDFYIVDDIIHVIGSRPAKRYGDYFLRQIVKLEGVMTELDRIKLERLTLMNFNGFSLLNNHAPNLQFFDIRGVFDGLDFENTFRLYIVSIGLNVGYDVSIPLGSPGNLIKFFSHLLSIQRLEIKSYFLKYLVVGMIPGRLPNPCIELNFLSVRINFFNVEETSAALCLLRRSPNSQELEILARRPEEEQPVIYGTLDLQGEDPYANWSS